MGQNKAWLLKENSIKKISLTKSDNLVLFKRVIAHSPISEWKLNLDRFHSI